MSGNKRATRNQGCAHQHDVEEGMDLKPKGRGRLNQKTRFVWQRRRCIDNSRISQLTDEVLHRILSSVSTLDVVRTSILSTRWKNLWHSAPNLDLDQAEFDDIRLRSPNIQFPDFVNHMFSSRSSDIRKLRLHTSIESCANLVCKAMRHYNIVELDLDFRYSGYSSDSSQYSEVDCELPISVFTSKTLEVLKVGPFISLRDPNSNSTIFQSLKSLNCYMMDPSDTPSMEKLISKCPLLEDLTINGDYFHVRIEEDVYKLKFKISAPALKTLRLLDWKSNVVITISCPKLENLLLFFCDEYNSGLPKCLFNGVNHLAKAVISFDHITQDYLDRLTVLLASVSGVKHLSLSLKSTLTCYLSKHFDNLKQLDMTLFSPSDWDNMTDFLKRSPYLEDLVLNFSRYNWRNLAYEEEYEPFKPPEIVPACVLSHLKTVYIRNFTGCDDEFEVIKNLLKNGGVLEKVTISTHGVYLFETRRMTKAKFREKLLKYQNRSKTCEIEVQFQTHRVKSITDYESDYIRNLLVSEDGMRIWD